MNTADLITSYDRAVEALRTIVRDLARDQAPRLEYEHAKEARARLEQMAFALREYYRADRAYGRFKNIVAAGPRPTGPRLLRFQERRGRLLHAMVFYTEAFYYFGHRASTCLRHIDGFGGFKPSQVRIVRNDLIEHPKDLIQRNLKHDPAVGVIVKPYRDVADSKVPRDQGLLQSAEQFILQLRERLEQRLAKRGNA
jgi:hypothetical protein